MKVMLQFEWLRESSFENFNSVASTTSGHENATSKMVAWWISKYEDGHLTSMSYAVWICYSFASDASYIYAFVNCTLSFAVLLLRPTPKMALLMACKNNKHTLFKPCYLPITKNTLMFMVVWRLKYFHFCFSNFSSFLFRAVPSRICNRYFFCKNAPFLILQWRGKT